MYSKSVYLFEYYKKYTEHASGLQKPFYKAILKQNKKKFTKEKKIQKKNNLLHMSQKEKTNKRDNANMLNNKVFFFLFFNTKYKQRTHILKAELRTDTRSWRPFRKREQEFVYLCLCRYIQRLGYVKIKDHKRPSHKSTNACCI